jgi:type IV secretion system protein VirD4
MVSRQETARPLLTPGEVMQLPPNEAVVQVSSVPPIRATKVRYYLDRELAARVASPPSELLALTTAAPSEWTSVVTGSPGVDGVAKERTDEGGHRIEPEFEGAVQSSTPPADEDVWLEVDPDADETPQAEQLRRFRTAARQAALDPDDGIPL